MFTPEEEEAHAAIAKTYNANMMKRQNRMVKDITLKIVLKKAAMRALPENLRIQAEIIDDTPPPNNRPFPIFDTPPIKDFDFRKYIKGSGGDDKEGDDVYFQ